MARRRGARRACAHQDEVVGVVHLALERKRSTTQIGHQHDLAELFATVNDPIGLVRTGQTMGARWREARLPQL